MIEKISEVDHLTPAGLNDKLNELIEASNRQDRAIGFFLTGGEPSDFHKACPEDESYWFEVINAKRR